MKVVITGASGMLGASCCDVFSEFGYEVVSIPYEVLSTFSTQNISSYISGANILIHAAANTNVEQCEIDVDNCYRDNYLLTEFLAKLCLSYKIKMVYISSAGVYGDYQQEPYREYSEVYPTTHHHRAKFLGEKSVRLASFFNIIVRTGWLFGGAFKNPKNFVARRIEDAQLALKTGEIIYSNDEQKGCPTFSVDVARYIIKLISLDSHGVYNLVNQGHASRMEYVQAIYKFANLAVDVHPVNSDHFNRLAKVSKNEMVLNWRASLLGLPEMPNWKSSLELYIKSNLN